VVRDQPSRFSVFSSEGEYLGGWRLDSGYGTNTPFFLDGQGGILNPTFRDRLVQYALDGTPGDTVPVPTRGFTPPRLEISTPGGTAWYSVPFMPAEHWTITTGGQTVFGISDRYRIERWSRTTVLRIGRVVDPVPVEREEAARHREGITRNIRQANDPAWEWQGPDIPSTKPFFTALLGGIDGSIWVIRPTQGTERENPQWDPSREETGPRTIWVQPVVADVFDAEGRYLGPVRIPENVGLWPTAVVSAERLWTTMYHHMGFPQVARFRLEVGGR